MGSLAPDFEAYLREHLEACHVHATGQPAGEVLNAVRRQLFAIPHPEEPEDGLLSFASEVVGDAMAASFWFDASDAIDAVPAIVDAIAAVASSSPPNVVVGPPAGWQPASRAQPPRAPSDVSPVLARVIDGARHDRLDDPALRAALAGSADRGDDDLRVVRLIDWAVRVDLPRFLVAVDEPKLAAALGALPPLRRRRTAEDHLRLQTAAMAAVVRRRREATATHTRFDYVVDHAEAVGRAVEHAIGRAARVEFRAAYGARRHMEHGADVALENVLALTWVELVQTAWGSTRRTLRWLAESEEDEQLAVAVVERLTEPVDPWRTVVARIDNDRRWRGASDEQRQAAEAAFAAHEPFAIRATQGALLGLWSATCESARATIAARDGVHEEKGDPARALARELVRPLMNARAESLVPLLIDLARGDYASGSAKGSSAAAAADDDVVT